jgi:hypothetical protein
MMKQVWKIWPDTLYAPASRKGRKLPPAHRIAAMMAGNQAEGKSAGKKQ